MKKIVSAFVIVLTLILIMVSCNKKSPNAPYGKITPLPTNTNTPAIDNSMYGFENGTEMNWKKKLGGVSGVSNSADMAYRGARSLKLTGTFTAGASNSAEVAPPVPADFTGKKIYGRIYLPADFPTTGGCIYIQSGPSSCWEQGPWVNGLTKGGWTTLEIDPANPAQIYGTNPNHASVSILGINFNPGAVYTGSGNVYFDTIEIVSAGTPTFTRTITETHTISPTVTETITGTPPTSTITPTITQTTTYVSTPQPPNDPNIQYYGRWNMANPLQPKAGWSANYIIAGFSGTSISIKMNSQWDAWYAYAIDDFSDHNAFTKFRVKTGRDSSGAIPTQTPQVITGLADTDHTIMLVRRSEGQSGVDTFLGFGLDTGKTLAAPAPTVTTRKMEFIGDSITCGSQNEYVAAVPTATADLPCEWGGCVSNTDTSFGMVLSRMYGAEGRNICRGGIGMYRNCSGCSPDYTMPQVFPYMYFETVPSGASLTWNFASWQADVVVIALGTNDNPGAPDQAAFQAAYTGFLTTLRSYYPNAYILCTEPVPTWMTTTVGSYISGVVTAFADAKVLYVPVRNPPISADFPLSASDFAADNTHPVVSAHVKIANGIKSWIDANIMAGLIADHGW